MADANNPFDFTGADNTLGDIFSEKTRETLRRLEQQGMRPHKAIDLFYDALEAPGVNEMLRLQAIDVCERGATKLAEEMCGSMFKSNLEPQEIVRRLRASVPGAITQMTADTQRISQEAIRISRIRGVATNPLLREIAREASVLPAASRNSLVTMMTAFKKAYQRAHNPPFDFRGAKTFDEIVYGSNSALKKLQNEQGVRTDVAIDIFYDALEASGVDESLRRQVTDHLAASTVQQIESDVQEFAKLGGDDWINTQHPNVERFWLNGVQGKAQQAIRLAKIKGSSAPRLLQEVAREVSALNELQRKSLSDMMKALTKAYDAAQQPAPIQRRGRIKPSRFDM